MLGREYAWQALRGYNDTDDTVNSFDLVYGNFYTQIEPLSYSDIPIILTFYFMVSIFENPLNQISKNPISTAIKSSKISTMGRAIFIKPHTRTHIHICAAAESHGGN